MKSDITRVVVTPLKKKRSKTKSVQAKSKSSVPYYEISSSSVGSSSSLSPPAPVTYCPAVREDEIRQLHAMLQGYMESSKCHMICVTGPPGTGKTQTLKVLLEGIQRGDYSQFTGVGIDDHDLRIYGQTSACFIQAFSINLSQSNIRSSAEYQLAEYIVSCCIQRNRYKLGVLNKLAKQAAEADSILSCIPTLVSILPRYLLIGIDEIDRLFSVRLATSRRQTRLTRNMTPIHFIGDLASKALEMKQCHVILIGISNEERIVREMQQIRTYHDRVHQLSFKPYNFIQLNTLVQQRQDAQQASHPGAQVAIEYGTRKVASSTGDCRQLLDMLTRLRLDGRDDDDDDDDDDGDGRRGGNLSDTSPTRDMTEPAPIVTVESVQKILGSTFQTDVARIVNLIETLTSQQQVIALSAAKLIVMRLAATTMPSFDNDNLDDTLSNRIWIKLPAAQATYNSFCRMMGIQPFSSAGFRNAVDALVTAGLFDIKQETAAAPPPSAMTSAWSTPTKPKSLPRGGGGLSKRRNRDASVSRQRTPIKRRMGPLTPLSPEFGKSAAAAAYSDLSHMSASITLTVESSRVQLIIEKTQSRGVVKVFKLFTCPSRGGNSDDDL